MKTGTDGAAGKEAAGQEAAGKEAAGQGAAGKEAGETKEDYAYVRYMLDAQPKHGTRPASLGVRYVAPSSWARPIQMLRSLNSTVRTLHSPNSATKEITKPARSCRFFKSISRASHAHAVRTKESQER